MSGLDAGPARWGPTGSVFHYLSDFVLHWFSGAFWHGFRLDFGAVLDIRASFWHTLFDRRICMDFHWILMDFRDPETMKKLIFTWYSRKKQRNRTFRFYIDFVPAFGHILAWFSEPFSMIVDTFSALIVGRIFGCVFLSFRHQTGSQMAPQMDKKNRKKWKWCVPVQRTRPSLCFDRILDPFWWPFGTFWASVGHHLGSISVRIIYY